MRLSTEPSLLACLMLMSITSGKSQYVWSSWRHKKNKTVVSKLYQMKKHAHACTLAITANFNQLLELHLLVKKQPQQHHICGRLTSSAPSSSFPFDHWMPLLPMTTMVTSRAERSVTWKRSEQREGSSISRLIRYLSLRLHTVALHSLNCWMNFLKRQRILFRVNMLYSWMRLRMHLGRKDLQLKAGEGWGGQMKMESRITKRGRDVY